MSARYPCGRDLNIHIPFYLHWSNTGVANMHPISGKLIAKETDQTCFKYEFLQSRARWKYGGVYLLVGTAMIGTCVGVE